MSSAVIGGYLFKLGDHVLFKSWTKRYFELKDDVLSMSVLKGGIKTFSFHLHPDTLYEESSLRHFCFSLTNSSGESIHLAAENSSTKEAWSEKIQLHLMHLRLARHRKAKPDSIPSEFVKYYQNRPTIYFKIIKARNLLGKDVGGTSDPYVNICLGPSTAKTTTRKKTINPEWGMVFNFSWDRWSRYAKIDIWDEDYASNDDFLGLILIPLSPLRDGQSFVQWYPVGKRSPRSSVRGEIEIEISCSGDPDPAHNAWHFFREVRQLPEFQLNYCPTRFENENSNSSICDKLPNNAEQCSFPFSFPPIQTEYLEDISIQVVMSPSHSLSTIFCRGVLLLTNYRLIFVSLPRIFSLSKLSNTRAILKQLTSSSTTDLTMQIPLGCILSASLASEVDPTNVSVSCECLRIQTTDNRRLNFLFRTDVDYSLPASFGKESIDSSRKESNLSHSDAEKMEGLELSFLRLISESPHFVDALDSDEGSPCQRIHYRLHLFVVNRDAERRNLIKIHDKLLSPLESQLFQLGGASEFHPRCSSVAIDDDNPIQLPLGWSNNEDRAAADQFEQMEMDFSIDHYRKFVKSLTLAETQTLLDQLTLGWTLYDPIEEFRRMGIPDWLWTLSSINCEYKLCSSYPPLLVLPSSVEEEIVRGSASFRSKGRFPTLVWRSLKNNCSISRSSQPMVGIAQNRSTQDEILINAFNKNGGLYAADRYLNSEENSIRGKPFAIFDARPLLNATANQAAGKGFENEKNYENTSVKFMDIVNIHAVRKSLELLEDACLDSMNWLKNLDSSGWLTHLRMILQACLKIVHCIAFEGMSVLVHCSDGWDRTAQLTSISMLLLDPFYRTLRGFIVLIEKEWVSFGHKFADRLGWTRFGWRDEERSPIFMQFLDCCHQILLQRPHAFEFNQELLLFLAEHIHSGWFGNFLFNCYEELDAEKKKTLSIWNVVLNNDTRFRNPNFCPMDGPVIPIVSPHRIVIWSEWFLHWEDTLWEASWAHDLQQREIASRTQPNAAPTTIDLTRPNNFWADDKSVSSCRRCDRKFSLIRRRHHCRACGHIFCEQCANEQRFIPNGNFDLAQRCCIDCARMIDLNDHAAQVSLLSSSSVNSHHSPSKNHFHHQISRSVLGDDFIRQSMSSKVRENSIIDMSGLGKFRVENDGKIYAIKRSNSMSSFSAGCEKNRPESIGIRPSDEKIRSTSNVCLGSNDLIRIQSELPTMIVVEDDFNDWDESRLTIYDKNVS